MNINVAILLAAMGITVLEMSEASAVGMALYADTKRTSAYGAVMLGVITVFIPTFLAGNYIMLLPIFYVRIASATLLLYFGLRLVRSARRSFKFQRIGPPKGGKSHEPERGLLATGYSVGLVEAFEAAIVLVALFPESYNSTWIGLVIGVGIVVTAAFMLRSQIRKVKQATIKTAVSALLLSFSSFWYIESVRQINDIFLVPLFVGFYLVVYAVATHGIPAKSKESAATS